MNRLLILLTGCFLQLSSIAAAQSGFLGGTLRDEANHPVAGATIHLKKTDRSVITDSLGAFRFKDLPEGNYELEVLRTDFKPFTETIYHNNADQFVALTVPGISVENTSIVVDNLPTISLGEDELKDNGSSAVSSILSSARDPFVSAATFNFSAARFRIRGYDDDNFITLMNGTPMSDLSNGRTIYNTWSGLNDVMRSRENSIGMAQVPYAFGGIGGAYSIDSRASRQRKQLSVTYSASNRQYDNRFMVTWGSGLLENGWSVALSFSRRWADEGFVPGTFYDGNSFFTSVEKIINPKHSVSFTAFGSMTTNGRAGLAVREIQYLAADNYYNPLWGYQINGSDTVRRNSSIARSTQPIMILEHEWKIDERRTLQTSLAFNGGSYKVSGLDWYEAADPRPDYYRNLPSFDPFYGEDPAAYAQYSAEVRNALSSDEFLRQIQWNRLYEANAMNDTTFNGTHGKWAKYIVGDRVTDNKRTFFNSTYSDVISDNLTFQGGFSFQQQNSDYYREVNDLLGADFYVDLNQFGDLDNTGDSTLLQNDLNRPDRILGVGDQYGYDYSSHISKSMLWGQVVYKLDRFDFFLAMHAGTNSFQRIGRVRSGVFRDDSYGPSRRKNFLYGGAKGGITYKYDGRNYFVINGTAHNRAPYFENAFVSPATRNTLVGNLSMEQVYSVEGGYLLKAPRIKAKVMGYYTRFVNGTDARRFYHEDFQNFVNYSLTGICKRHTGVEIGAEMNLGGGISMTTVATIGQFIYDRRASGTATQDNKDTILIQDETIYWKNLRVANGPQDAYTLGFNYRSPKFWFLNVNLNYFDQIYADVNPARRTIAALDLVDQGSEKWVDILSQERLPGQYTMDFSAGYSYRLNNRFKNLKNQTFININLGVSNIFDNTSLVTTAFEQLRFDFTDNNVNKFPTKYGYGFGRTYFLNLVFRMN
ncbi:MAG: hypothetical protein RL213_790 [Bacteroidota bacterium]|jgi:hypothetical protein